MLVIFSGTQLPKCSLGRFQSQSDGQLLNIQDAVRAYQFLVISQVLWLLLTNWLWFPALLISLFLTAAFHSSLLVMCSLVLPSLSAPANRAVSWAGCWLLISVNVSATACPSNLKSLISVSSPVKTVLRLEPACSWRRASNLLNNYLKGCTWISLFC